MRSRLLLASAGLLWLLTGCVSLPANLQRAIDVAGSTYESHPRNIHSIATPLLPEAGDRPAMMSTSTATNAPTITPSATPRPPTSTPVQLAPARQLHAATATTIPAVPTRLIIPAIDLDVPVIAMGWSIIEQDGQPVGEWDVPEWRAAGWLKTSALISAIGNTVLEGHQDMAGRVFENLEALKEGDAIIVQTESLTRTYIIALRTIVLEKGQPLEVRYDNARWIGPSDDERITLVTCWPRNDNTHRLILVALPVH